MRWFPELLLIESEEDREKAWLAASPLAPGRGAAQLMAFCAMVVLATALGRFLGRQVSRALGPYFSTEFLEVVDLLVWLLVAFLAPTFVIFACRRRIQRNLRSHLADRGIPICLGCGYSLRGLPEPRCPECRTEFDPRRFGAVADEEQE